MKANLILLSIFLILTACLENLDSWKEKDETSSQEPQGLKNYEIFFRDHPTYYADFFDFPVGKPEAKGYYNAQGFQENQHLGDDWNAVTGGDTDLGDPIYAIANAYVYSAKEEGPGWGKVIRLIHFHPQLTPPYIESLYAHCDSMWVETGQAIKRGEQIGSIGNADGAYLAHLHLEIRDALEMPIGGGYASNTEGFLDPTAFIKSHRRINEK